MELETLNGTVERVTYFNPENGYSVLKVHPDSKKRLMGTDKEGLVAVVGVMPELAVGENVRFTGKWINDARYGRQFKAETVVPIKPTSERGITRYLASGIVKGIGPKTAEKIVDYFGVKTLDVLDRQPERLNEVPGLKKELIRGLIAAWKEAQYTRSTIIFLQGLGISARTSNKIYQEYGEETIKTIQEDPYQLAQDIFGIGFIKADTIARGLGVEPDAIGRVRAGLHYALTTLAQDGHTFAPRQVLMDTTSKLLQIDNPTRVAAVLKMQIETSELRDEALPSGDDNSPLLEAIYLPMYYAAERGATLRLKAIAAAPSPLKKVWDKVQWDDFLGMLAKDYEVTLTAQQRGAVQAALTSKVSVLTGGPGTGKTTTLHMVIQALNNKQLTFHLASPTGRAAKRLSEATGEPASTIHRLLEYSPGLGGFARDEEYPLKADMVIVDESSMIDIVLFYSLLRALPPGTHLMLVGDVDQLPSVGAGNVLRDVIDSGMAQVTRLDTIFRQSEDSHIIVNAHRVNHGQVPIFDNNRSKDFFIFRENDPQAVAELIVDIVQNRLPARFDLHPIDDIQVIAPMYRGPAGVNNLNEILQGALNGDPRLDEKKLGSRLFRAGDKVMQTKNNYDKEVFNGDIGRIRGIDHEAGGIEVSIDGRIIPYDWQECEELMHAYCISTHRSQGSEYPAVVMPIMTQHYMMLQRNLLYTAITRAKKMVVLVGNPQALHMAVSNNKVAQRYSGLLARLKNAP
ncbi:MAG: ATP-dependent RecD-like DNA helicase [Chloroflexi bacterium]|nr:ATP-dependent RecD-like DNA helicase [Chloroflexota bacterium]